MNENIGEQMYSWAQELFPLNRSLTGSGVRDTLDYIKNLIPDLDIQNVNSGEKAFDWSIPQEWNVKSAWIKDSSGKKIVDFQHNNLHLVGYSEPIHTHLSKSQLLERLYCIPEQPNAIPYITSYYKRDWGFCIAASEIESLKDDIYEVFIDSSLEDGILNFGEVFIPGKSEKEIILSTYICHPSMANNELSGPVVATALAQWISSNKDRKYSYRILFLPETIGAIYYISKNIEKLKRNVIAGWVLTCLGDDRTYSYIPSRENNALVDRVSRKILGNLKEEFQEYSWLDRGSDERQYCSPGVDLPISSIMRSKYGEYPEYHTSLDDLDFISPSGLLGGYETLKACINELESNIYPVSTTLCEPQLGRRNLYPTLSRKGSADEVSDLVNFLSMSDGKRSVKEISEYCRISEEAGWAIFRKLVDARLLHVY